MNEPDSGSTFLIVLCVSWATVLIGRGIYTRRSVVTGLITAVLAAP